MKPVKMTLRKRPILPSILGLMYFIITYGHCQDVSVHHPMLMNDEDAFEDHDSSHGDQVSFLDVSPSQLLQEDDMSNARLAAGTSRRWLEDLCLAQQKELDNGTCEDCKINEITSADKKSCEACGERQYVSDSGQECSDCQDY